MRTNKKINESGNVLICALGAILILSMIGAGVLSSSATRLNASCNHVRAWKEALSAAETGGDIAFAELRKTVADPSGTPSWDPGSWSNSGLVNAQFPRGTKHVLNPVVTFGNSNLRAATVVEACYFDPSTKRLTLVDASHTTTGNVWYRVRSKGTAPLPNLRRTGMDDALINDGAQRFAAFGSTAMQDITARGKGDSLLRKIDFNVDHFVATYGPEGDRQNTTPAPPSVSPSISRRIEQIVSPVSPFFDAAIKTTGWFYGLGSASYIDSYNSNNGPYIAGVKDNPSHPFYGDSRRGNVQIASATATVKGSIYGDVATDGGNVRSGSPGIVYGTIDNNVPMTLDPFRPDTSGWTYQPAGSGPGQLPAVVSSNTTLNMQTAGTKDAPVRYLVSSVSDALTINPAVVSGSSVDTYVAIYVTGNFAGNNSGITINPKVHAKIYIAGNLSTKAVRIVNNSPNTPNFPSSGPYAGNLQFYGISPLSGTQTFNLDSGGGQFTLACTFYAPGADFTFNGAPDFIGTVVARTFYANGNITWHYDRALNDDGQLLDMRIASYVEDTR